MRSDPHMRAAQFEDVPELLRLIERAVERGCRRHYGPAQRRAVFLSYAHNLFCEVLGPYETTVVEAESRVVAFAQWDPRDGRLRALFVDGPAQEQGYGRTLVDRVAARAARRGCARLHGAMSLNAVSFYERAGFAPCAGPRRLASAPVDVPVVPMERILGPRDRVIRRRLTAPPTRL